MELLLAGGADALARNFVGLQPHKLASPGSPAWEQLLAHLEWRACLDEPRLCHFLPSGEHLLCLLVMVPLVEAHLLRSGVVVYELPIQSSTFGRPGHKIVA